MSDQVVCEGDVRVIESLAKEMESLFFYFAILLFMYFFSGCIVIDIIDTKRGNNFLDNEKTEDRKISKIKNIHVYY